MKLFHKDKLDKFSALCGEKNYVINDIADDEISLDIQLSVSGRTSYSLELRGDYYYKTHSTPMYNSDSSDHIKILHETDLRLNELIEELR